jgi:hypothetical protein
MSARREDARRDAGEPARLASGAPRPSPPRGVNVHRPGGSQVVLEHPRVADAISVPARRPIAPVYVRRFVAFIEDVSEP